VASFFWTSCATPARPAERQLARLALTLLVAACAPAGAPAGGRQDGVTSSATAATVTAAAQPRPSPGASAAATGSAAPSHETNEPHSITVIAGGDVSFGRVTGQLLLHDPSRDDFTKIRPLLERADVRFVNLESTLSEQGGRTVNPHSKLVFTGPPVAAEALARAKIDVVSLANNHAWDFGRQALLETLAHLDRVGIAYTGVGRTRDAAYGPTFVERRGFKLAFLAVTDMWNQVLHPHPGKEHIADAAEAEQVLRRIRALRRDEHVDFILVSFHGGVEYGPTPLPRHRQLLHKLIAAGADAVIGHHPHVLQRVELLAGKPIFYSLGNLMMRMKPGKRWTEIGALARLELSRTKPPVVELCPHRIWVHVPIPLAGDERRTFYEGLFRHRLGRLLQDGAAEQPDSAAELGDFTADGCAPLRPRR